MDNIQSQPQWHSPNSVKESSVPDVSIEGALKILLVDDEPDLRQVMSRLLKMSGHAVVSAASGLDALSKLDEETHVDLVIMDQNMPHMSGTETIEKIRERGLAVPIMVSSGDPDLKEMERLRQEGIAMLAKPFLMDDLLDRLAGIVPQRRNKP